MLDSIELIAALDDSRLSSVIRKRLAVNDVRSISIENWVALHVASYVLRAS